MKRKRKNLGLFIAIAVIGALGIGAIFAYGAYVTANTHQPFVWERRHNALRMYREMTEMDIAQNHPQSPARLMEIYNDTFFFLHGDFILDEDVFMEVIEFQRVLFSEELLANTTARQQFDNLMRNLDTIRADGSIIFRRSQVENIRHDFHDQRTALAYVVHPFIAHENLYRVYHLVMDNEDRWVINSWSLADNEFNIIE